MKVTCEHHCFQARDNNSDSVISYKIISGNEAGLFHVEPYTGHVRVASSLADKDGSKFTLEIMASDGGEESSINVTVNVSVFYKPSAQLVRHRGLHFESYKNSLILLERKDYAKYLGVLIDSSLTWKQHILFISSKISKSLGIISRLRHFVPTDTLLSIYRSLIQLYITYGIAVWGQAAQTNLDKLLILQKRALRLIHFAPYRSHAIPLFIHYNILPLNFQYYQSV